MARIHPGPNGPRLVVHADRGLTIEVQGIEPPETILGTLADETPDGA